MCADDRGPVTVAAQSGDSVDPETRARERGSTRVRGRHVKEAPVSVREASPSSRSAGPDQLKALLLILVIFGHTFAESIDESFTKWVIYGFHMPAFLFLSGYLLRTERLRERDYPQLLTDYSRRMIAPWLVVSVLWQALWASSRWSTRSARWSRW